MGESAMTHEELFMLLNTLIRSAIDALQRFADVGWHRRRRRE